MLSVLACGLPGDLAGLQATAVSAEETAEAAIDLYGPTLEAQMTLYGPTLQAQATQFVLEATEHGPELNATLTAAVATVDALANPTVQAQANAAMTAAVATAQAAIPGGGNAAAPAGIFTGGDDYSTTLVQLIAVGETRNATLENVFFAHNWLFEGVAGQSVTILVEGIGGTDPRARLIDPEGNVIAQNDDMDSAQGNLNAQIITTLPVSGIYTVRVDVFVPGEYTISVR